MLLVGTLTSDFVDPGIFLGGLLLIMALEALSLAFILNMEHAFKPRRKKRSTCQRKKGARKKREKRQVKSTGQVVTLSLSLPPRVGRSASMYAGMFLGGRVRVRVCLHVLSIVTELACPHTSPRLALRCVASCLLFGVDSSEPSLPLTPPHSQKRQDLSNRKERKR